MCELVNRIKIGFSLRDIPRLLRFREPHFLVIHLITITRQISDDVPPPSLPRAPCPSIAPLDRLAIFSGRIDESCVQIRPAAAADHFFNSDPLEITT